jgi:hypothetical protein
MKIRGARPIVTSMHDLNGESPKSLWPDKKLDWEKLFTVRRQLKNANSHDGASGDAFHYAESKWENHSLLRRDLKVSPSQYIGIYIFLFLLFALCCMMWYVVEKGYSAISSQSFSFFVG